MTATRRDPSNVWTSTAIAHLVASQDARNRYDVVLQAAIARYGDYHRADPFMACHICAERGIQHTEHERLNHQNGGPIAGVYADHFPDAIKSVLRTYARLIGENTDCAFVCWRKAGRRIETIRAIAVDYRRLTDGRISYD